MRDIPALFGSMVFNDAVMEARLPKDIYKSLKRTIATGKHLDLDVANVVATAMKEWAIEKGVTHFTHWFQPMTGITAEKHDSFISPTSGGKVIMEFSGKELVRGEPDASSFPSGGLRATFEARGYTAWDPTSYAFIKDGSLCIPTAFCSYNGEALDNKTPLLRSMEALDRQAMRILRLFGDNSTERVITTVGPEQEYFIIDRSSYEQRPDLIYCGRTLFGARPPKGQELEDQYFGAIKPGVSTFMKELDEELWKLGIYAKTKHNEVAPSQHELAPVFSTTNIAADHNQLTMEMMKNIAQKHGYTCLLHEKPFAGINGSGKHNNWSMSTDKGANLLEPGDTPADNARFLLFLVAILKAVDEYADLLRISVATSANDHRLGANEAPPAIISVFLGDELTEIVDNIAQGNRTEAKTKIQMEIGATVLPHFPKDTTDRNRTSPFAFTGNKFEFRMPGSSVSISMPNAVLNTIVAEALKQIADKLEKSSNFNEDLKTLIKDTIDKHMRIVFNGNNYTDEWVQEAEVRGLLNLKSTVEALPYFLSEKNIKLFTTHKVFTEVEMHSRYEIMLENYCKSINIEALTMVDMAKRQILPSVLAYENSLISLATAKKALNPALSSVAENALLENISKLAGCMWSNIEALEDSIVQASNYAEAFEMAKHYRENVFLNMIALRSVADELETMVDKKYWPFPVYGDILFSVK